ncbi:MAG: dienelactone hydrolase family protein [Blastocatellia bacterium]|nr:dienelactone hydrolase family protein [Blastocatellia bacterium]
MKRILITSLIAAALVQFPTGADDQQIPLLPELITRFEQFNRLYTQRRKAGADLSAVEALRKRGEEAFKSFDIPAMIETLSEGMALLEGRRWDERQKFMDSLTLAPDRLVIELNRELQVSLIQMFPVDGEKVFGSRPTVSFEIIPSRVTPPPDFSVTPEPVIIAQRLRMGETVTRASRRLRLLDGIYRLIATVEAEGQKVIEVRKTVYAVSDFAERIQELSSMIDLVKNSTELRVKAYSGLVTTPEFQLQRLASLNSGTGEYDLNAIGELDRIEKVLIDLSEGRNPFYAERGEVERAYRAKDGKLVPYRVYVPNSYDGEAARPLVVMLHGALGDERSYFSNLYDPSVIKGEAERRGYILVAPNGRDRQSGYDDAGQEDVLEVIKGVLRDYEIDESRIYLTGHSIGASGVWLVAAKQAELFAALAPVSGMGPGKDKTMKALFEKLKATPALVLHGARDGIIPPDNSRKMAAAARKARLKAEYVEVPEADHITVVAATWPTILDFFDKHAKQTSEK